MTSASRDSPLNRCAECGCPCQNCIIRSEEFAYQQEEIEKLRSLARCQQASINRLECDLQSESAQRGREQQKLQDELGRLRDRYDRLLESHKKLSRLNSGLEERLLTMAERLQAGEAELAEQQRRLELSEAERFAARDEAERLRAELGSVGILTLTTVMQSSDGGVVQPLPAASVSVPLPTFPPTFAHVPSPPPPQQPQQIQAKALNTVCQPSGSVVLHL